ncbi:MAG: hypothetical protein JWM08_2620 [Candidatus Angelobacter sp.]|nr:hypothetical protein [Candidatus Angelobacter sp.]
MRTIVRRILPVLLLYITCLNVRGGDDASGPIRYSADLSQKFSTYVMSDHDKEWSRSLAKALKYTGPVVHFVRTSLPLTVDNQVIQGAIYQAIEKPDYFYVINGDAMLLLGSKWPYNPGVGGFSMHAPKSRRFIVCLNLDGGVPFLSGSPVEKGRVDWKGHDYDRFK